MIWGNIYLNSLNGCAKLLYHVLEYVKTAKSNKRHSVSSSVRIYSYFKGRNFREWKMEETFEYFAN